MYDTRYPWLTDALVPGSLRVCTADYERRAPRTAALLAAAYEYLPSSTSQMTTFSRRFVCGASMFLTLMFYEQYLRTAVRTNS